MNDNNKIFEKDEVFIYEWDEPAKKHRVTFSMILQAIFLSMAIGIIPVVFHFLHRGYTIRSIEIISWAVLMIIIVPVIITASVRDSSSTSASALLIDRCGFVRITRYVTSDTGRQYFATWDSLEWRQVRILEKEHILQIDAAWKVSAYKIKADIFHKKQSPGRFVDSDVRDYPQTFRLPPKEFIQAMEYIKTCNIPVRDMAISEYEKAVPFILKHYTI